MSPTQVRALVLGLLGLSLAVAWRVGLDTEARVGQVLPGFVVFENAAIGPVVASPEPTALREGRVHYLDRVLLADGRAISSGRDLERYVSGLPPDRPVHYALERPDGSRYETDVRTQRFSRRQFRDLYLPYLLGGFLLLGVGALPVLVRPDLRVARIFFAASWAGVTNFCILNADYFFEYRFLPWNYAVSFAAKATMLHLAAEFPQRRWPLTRHPGAGLAVGYGGLAALSLGYVYAFEHSLAWQYALDRLAIPTFLAGVGLLTANVAHTALRSEDALLRQRARVVAIGPALITVAGALVGLASWGLVDPGIPTGTYILLAWAFPASMAYAILKHNLFDFEAVVRRGLTSGALLLAMAVLFLGLFTALQRLAGPATAWASAGLAAIASVILVPLVEPLRRRVEAGLEQLFFPDYRRTVTAIHDACIELTRALDSERIARLLCETIARTMSPAGVRVVVRNPEHAFVELAIARSDPPLKLAENDPLAAALRRGRVVDVDAGDASQELRERLGALDLKLVVPLPARRDELGAFLLGARSDGRLYTRDDRELLETLAAQAATALANARAWNEVELLRRRLADEVVYLREEIRLSHGFTEIVAECPAMKSVLGQIEQVAPTQASVLVKGETGTGKELVVRALHGLSERSDRVLVKVACAAIPETLLESELFGHERGAFTGATQRQRGRFEIADGGTLFFDDVDTLPLGVQAKLLRALQEGEIQPLGAAGTRKVDVRVVAATNKDLLREVTLGNFREDLYYRLNVVPIEIPPLRERPGDVRLLVEHFVEHGCAESGRSLRGISEEALADLERYRWPGNVRELRNVIERALVMGRDDVLRLAAPLEAGGSRTSGARTGSDRGTDADANLEGGPPLAERLRSYKIHLIERALEQSGGNQRKAAELLGMHRPSLSRMIRDLDISVRPERAGPGGVRSD